MGLKEVAEQLIAARAEEKGIERGKEEKDIFFVTNLLQSTNFSVERITTLAGVSVDFVRQMREQLVR